MEQDSLPLEIEVQDGRIVLRGEIDLGGVARLRTALDTPADGSPLVLDFAGVTFMDSAGLRELLDAWRRVGSVTILDPAPNVERLLAVTQADSVLKVERTT